MMKFINKLFCICEEKFEKKQLNIYLLVLVEMKVVIQRESPQICFCALQVTSLSKSVTIPKECKEISTVRRVKMTKTPSYPGRGLFLWKTWVEYKTNKWLRVVKCWYDLRKNQG